MYGEWPSVRGEQVGQGMWGVVEMGVKITVMSHLTTAFVKFLL